MLSDVCIREWKWAWLKVNNDVRRLALGDVTSGSIARVTQCFPGVKVGVVLTAGDVTSGTCV